MGRGAPRLNDNGVYSLKWRLTDRYLRWGTLADPRPGRGHADQCANRVNFCMNCASRVSRAFDCPHLLSRKIMINRRHWMVTLTAQNSVDGVVLADVASTMRLKCSIFACAERKTDTETNFV